MMRFKQFISEGKYPMWVRLTVGTLVLRINNLTKQIEKEDDPIKQNKLIDTHWVHRRQYYLSHAAFLDSGFL